MLARVVTFEGGSADSIRAAMEKLNSSIDVYEVGAEVRM
jgi:hypothetical protein